MGGEVAEVVAAQVVAVAEEAGVEWAAWVEAVGVVGGYKLE